MLFIFDMGGVVAEACYIDSVFKFLGMSEEIFYKICSCTGENLWSALETGRMCSVDFWKEFSRRWKLLSEQTRGNNGDKIETAIPGPDNMGLTCSVPPVKELPPDIFRLFFHPRLNEKTVAIIERLRKKHRVVCGTNTIDSHWECHMERGDYRFFDQTYASNKIYCAKPAPLFFETILMAEGVSPEEVFFTDDRKENCQAASTVGIQAVQFLSPEDLESHWSRYF